jgi:hypothetical protein
VSSILSGGDKAAPPSSDEVKNSPAIPPLPHTSSRHRNFTLPSPPLKYSSRLCNK